MTDKDLAARAAKMPYVNPVDLHNSDFKPLPFYKAFDPMTKEQGLRLEVLIRLLPHRANDSISMVISEVDALVRYVLDGPEPKCEVRTGKPNA